MDILILPGDGIGPEITAATRVVLDRLNDTRSLGLEFAERPMGLATLATEGHSFPDAVFADVRAAAGVILAPVSTYEYPPADQGGVNPSAAIRRGLDLYANIRPARAYPGVPAMAPDIDLVVVRENTEGFYADRNMAVGSGEFMPTPDLALAVRKISREGSTRIARTAFEIASRRQRRLTVVHKANVLRLSDGLFLECVHAVAAEFPDITVDESIIDAMTARLIRTPGAFDVLVTTNMYGDILSDEATELAGGLGLGGALNAGDAHAIAQATHGSAPDIAGRDVANPTALLLSCAMLLDWLGARHRRDDLHEASGALKVAIEATLADADARTPDLGGNGSTSAFGEQVARALDA